ncbi:MAG: sigma-70 family RNA polymerase sigma factor [Armatimonadetes bacterium]|nr:sigma-70 family RNA polymerase sigma factor [Armatimonadota bacterium]
MNAELAVLYRVARRLGTTPEEAEDLVQQTVYKAYRSWHQFDGRYLRSWLVRILRNERLASLRSAKPEVEWDELNDEALVEEGFWPTVESNLEAARVLQALETLPEPYRLAVQLCDVEQMSYEEAAAAMDVPVGTVRSRLFRARMELRKRLGGEQ